jgi:cell division septal protein FtsQ
VNLAAGVKARSLQTRKKDEVLMSSKINRIMFTVGVFACLSGIASAQTTTSTDTKKFEVISVEGNQLVVRLPEGTREITVPTTSASRWTASNCPCSS